MFSIIGPYFDGDRVLDLFAGTGGLGIEALSRGAASAVFIDASAQSVEVVRRNLATTRLAERAEVYRNDARRALKLLQRKGAPFDLVFLDPPYAVKNCDELLSELADYGLMAEGGIAVVEHHPEVTYDDAFGGYARTRLAVYGEIALSIYRFSSLTDREPNSDTPANKEDA